MCRHFISSVSCGILDGPDNGAINCTGSVYEDTCSFTCDYGYELTGSDTRTCQSNGSWSGDETVCEPGIAFSWMNIHPSVVLYI